METRSHDIAELLERQYGDITRLMAALEDEQAALSGNDLPAIEAATSAKYACLLEIERDFQAQAALLAGAGLTADNAGMDSYLRRGEPDRRRRLDQRWRQIKELLRRCREQNLLNGRIVTASQRQTQTALTILRGGTATDDCYGRTGRAGNGLASRLLGKV